MVPAKLNLVFPLSKISTSTGNVAEALKTLQAVSGSVETLKKYFGDPGAKYAEGALHDLAVKQPDAVRGAMKTAQALGHEDLAKSLRALLPSAVDRYHLQTKVASDSPVVSDAAQLFNNMLKKAGRDAEKTAVMACPHCGGAVKGGLCVACGYRTSPAKGVSKLKDKKASMDLEDAAAEIYQNPILAKLADVGKLDKVVSLARGRVKNYDALQKAAEMGPDKFMALAAAGLDRKLNKQDPREI